MHLSHDLTRVVNDDCLVKLLIGLLYIAHEGILFAKDPLG